MTMAPDPAYWGEKDRVAAEKRQRLMEAFDVFCETWLPSFDAWREQEKPRRGDLWLQYRRIYKAAEREYQRADQEIYGLRHFDGKGLQGVTSQ